MCINYRNMHHHRIPRLIQHKITKKNAKSEINTPKNYAPTIIHLFLNRVTQGRCHEPESAITLCISNKNP